MSDAVVVTAEDNIEDSTIELKITSIMSSIVQQCSSKIFQVYISKHVQEVENQEKKSYRNSTILGNNRFPIRSYH